MMNSKTDTRLQALTHWVQDLFPEQSLDIKPASGDASFRRYFRVRLLGGEYAGHTYILMDAPPDKENAKRFRDVALAFADIGLHVPEVLEANLEDGYLLLGDLGDQLYLQTLSKHTANDLYGDALDALLTLQVRGPGGVELPLYSRELLMQEMFLFRDWYLRQHLPIAMNDEVIQLLDEVFDLLADCALEQAQVCVHRDYHSRNLMVVAYQNPGILDFQDAVIGPITYDLVSLLRDCYIAWPPEQVAAWALRYRDMALQAGVIEAHDQEQFLKWFDWMGIQRHLKATGIFARLNYRDGKSGYLQDIPRTLNYVIDVCRRYPQLHDFYAFLSQQVMPHLEEAPA